MSDQQQPSFNFGGPIGSLNINSGSGVQNTGQGQNIQVGDNNTQNITQTFNGELKPSEAISELAKSIPPEVATTEEIGQLVSNLEHEESLIESSPDKPADEVLAQAPTESYPSSVEGTKSVLAKIGDALKKGAEWSKPMLPILGRIGKRYLANSTGLLGVVDEICNIVTEK